MENLFAYLLNVLTPVNLAFCSLGVVIGIIVGAMPGLTATMAVAVLIPVTYKLDAITALVLLGSAYCGALYGGSISAILLNTPGTPAAAATCIEGYPMAQKGEAGRALGMATFASGIGGIISFFALLLMAPLLSALALKFAPSDYFLLALLGIGLIVSLSSKNFVKGLIAGVLGLLLATVGMEPMTGFPRFTFGNTSLYAGLPLVPTLVGLLSTSQLFLLTEQATQRIMKTDTLIGRIVPSLKELKRLIPIFIRSSIIGIAVGVMPGAGSNVATFIAYNDAKSISKDGAKFGTGVVDGIAATESCNNAVSGGSLAPMLTLGIPGSNTTAVLMGALMLHGMAPGPELFTKHAETVYSFIMSLLPANIIMVLFGLLACKCAVHIVRIPNNILAAVIMALSVVGAFALNNNFFNVYIMLIFGVIGYILKKLEIDVVPLVLAFILGSTAEAGLKRTIALAGPNNILLYIFSKPLSLILAVLVLITVLSPLVKMWKARTAK